MRIFLGCYIRFITNNKKNNMTLLNFNHKTRNIDRTEQKHKLI